MKRKKSMSRKAREELVTEIALRYAKAGKKEKGMILDEAVKDTGYNRKYLIAKLRKKAFSITVTGFDGKARKLANRKKSDVPGKLMHLSAASVDRLLRPARAAMRMKGRSGTGSPGSSLNAMIPIRAYYSMDERNEARFFEIDTVVHCGYGPQEGALWTLTLTDVSNGWVYIRVLRAKTQRCVMEALDDILDHAAYPVRELHMDNGSEFKNFGFLQWCQRHCIAYTRSRSYHKNDNCFVEAKNFTAVRSYVGYFRYQREESYDAMDDLYWHLERLLNL